MLSKKRVHRRNERALLGLTGRFMPRRKKSAGERGKGGSFRRGENSDRADESQKRKEVEEIKKGRKKRQTIKRTREKGALGGPL